ncbi:MAG: exonuclease domain-containing protein [Pseudomonadota bacterium]
MKNTPWILLDTKTTGFNAPVFVAELAAQRMCGWEPEGEPFCKLLNHNEDISAEASRVHGYTREILERDGETPVSVYRAFTAYAGNLPLVSFNLEYDLDEVLVPEWKRLSIAPIGNAGFCALRLAQRLLDPVPAGNCKLQTLRQYYHLPERGAHMGMREVETVADLMAHVLRPIAENLGLNTWDKIVAFAAEEWYPSRIPFGKYKGRLVGEARQDAKLRRWLDWLASSSNARSERMGRWYLAQLERGACVPLDSTIVAAINQCLIDNINVQQPDIAVLTIYINPALEQLRQLVASSRARLAELESTYTREKSRVATVQATLFQRLREHYQKRDRLRLMLEYRQKYLDSLVRGGEEEASQAESNYERARTQNDRDYEAAAAEADKKHLTAEEETELNRLWRKLVKLYHPDRFAHEPEKLATYEKLISAINLAKDNGDITILREIAEDPHGFILRQGWSVLDFSEDVELVQLRRLYETLQLEIVNVLEALGTLRESPDYELCRISEQKPGVLVELAKQRAETLDKESAELEAKADKIADEIAALGGEVPSRIV